MSSKNNGELTAAPPLAPDSEDRAPAESRPRKMLSEREVLDRALQPRDAFPTGASGDVPSQHVHQPESANLVPRPDLELAKFGRRIQCEPRPGERAAASGQPGLKHCETRAYPGLPVSGGPFSFPDHGT